MRTLLLLSTLALGCGQGSEPTRPNVLLITVESLRTDHVSFQDGELLTTPALEVLAEEGMVYEDAHSVTSWTLASHASLFTGLYPRAHATVGPKDALSDAYPTIAETLRDAGYQTAGVVSGPYLRTAHNLHQGFQHYDDSLSSTTHAKAHGDQTNPGMLERMLRFLDEERDPSRPFLLFGYFWDPHYDYLPPPPWDRKFVGPECEPVDLTHYEGSKRLVEDSPPGQIAYAISQYDGEIGWTDETLGTLFSAMRERGLWDDTLVIVTADHGEEFFEHGTKGHKHNLHVESVHVPLVVKYPSRFAARAKVPTRGRDERLVSLIDIAPTVRDVTGTGFPGPLHGHSLLEAAPAANRPIFYELLSVWLRRQKDGSTNVIQQQWFGVRQGRYKFLEVQPRGQRMLYDVVVDPGEQNNLMLASERPDAIADLRQYMQAWAEEMDLCRRLFGPSGKADLTPEELERLRELGYL